MTTSAAADEPAAYEPQYDLIQEHVADAAWQVIKRQVADPLALAARLCVEVEDAAHLLHVLGEAGIVGPPGPFGVRKVLVPDRSLPLKAAMDAVSAVRAVAFQLAA